MKKNRIEENKTDKHLAEKNQIEKNLIVDRLTVTYGEKLAVDGVSFSLSPGKIYVIVGESGSGKSTLLRTIGGLLTKEGKIVSGDIWMGEQNLIQLSEKEWCEVHGNKMGYIFQNPEQSLSPLAKIGKQFVECQNMHAKTAGKKSKKEILEDAEELLKELRFENPQRVLKSYPFELSGGMWQRVAIARAVAMEPELLVADEPIASLDVSIQAQIVNLFRHLQKEHGFSFLFIAHDLSMVRFLCDRVGVMHDGKLVEVGNVEDIFRHPKHPYTKALIESIPIPDPRMERQRAGEKENE